MDWKRKLAIMLRWSLLGAVLIGLFWGAWYFVSGEPQWFAVMSGLGIQEIMLPHLPVVSLSDFWIYTRFADILIAPIWAILITLALTAKRTCGGCRTMGALFGIVSGAFVITATFKSSLLTGMLSGTAISIFIMLLVAVEHGWEGIMTGTTSHLFSALLVALVFGIFAGIYYLIFAGVPLALLVLLTVASINRKRIASWLLAR